MKKVLIAMMLVIACVASVYAATPAEESAARIAKLEKLLKSVPGGTGVADLDSYVQASAKAATAAVANSELLKSLGDGEVSADVVLALTAGVKEEKDALEESTKLAPKAAEGLKKLNPMKAGKAKKALDFANNCSAVVTEESVYQAGVIAGLGK